MGESSAGTIDTFTYTLRNQLKTTSVDGKNAAYSYDPTGMRLSKTVNGLTTSQIWSGGNVVSEYGAENAVYRYGVKLVDMTQGGSQNYYLYNGHGDTTQLVNASGAVTANYQYDAFGNPVGDQNQTVYNPFRYNSQYTDDETGLIYLRNRYYDPSIGRFITEDPVRDGLNWYAYCGNNPINFIDPFGLKYKPRDDQTEVRDGFNLTPQAAALYDYFDSDEFLYFDSEVEEIRKNNQVRQENGFTVTSDEGNRKIKELVAAKKHEVFQADNQGKVRGFVFDVPSYIQGNDNLCWAYCKIMIKAWKEGKTYTQEQATQLAKELMIKMSRTQNIGGGGSYIGTIGGKYDDTKRTNESIGANMLKALKDGPAFARFGMSRDMGHLVVVTGYVYVESSDLPALTRVNDPSGYKSGQWQTIERFKDMYPDMPFDYISKAG